MIRLALSLCLALPAGADPVSPSAAEGAKAPLRASLLTPPGLPLVAGTRARGTAVRLSNEDGTLAVALRSLAWRHGVPRVSWLVPIQGRTTDRRDGTIELDPLATNLTELRFEHGLLLPGEEIVVPLDLPVEPGATQRLEVEYAIVGNDIRPWRSEVLLPRVDEMSHATFGAVTTDALELRRREGGGRALARSTMKEGYLPLGEGRATFEIEAAGILDASRTGGIARADAIEAAGHGDAVEVNARWEPTQRAWFVVAGDGRAVRVTAEGRESLGDGWSLNAPALFNADGEGNTRVMLDGAVFGDLVEVEEERYEGAFYVPGVTVLGPGELGKVLGRARERGVGVKVVGVDPNGFGVEFWLSIGG